MRTALLITLALAACTAPTGNAPVSPLTAGNVLPSCAGNGGCDANAICSFVQGRQYCVCRPGFAGDGKTCTASAGNCVTHNGGCDFNATCTYQGTSLTCACGPGYTGDGKTCRQHDGRTGAPCDLGTGNGCATDYDCSPTVTGGVCTKACSGSCGTTQTLPDQCIDGSCQRGCDVNEPNSCGRAELTCTKMNHATHAYCWPRCPDTACPEATTCNASTGACVDNPTP
jgi:hypothetical protein